MTFWSTRIFCWNQAPRMWSPQLPLLWEARCLPCCWPRLARLPALHSALRSREPPWGHTSPLLVMFPGVRGQDSGVFPWTAQHTLRAEVWLESTLAPRGQACLQSGTPLIPLCPRALHFGFLKIFFDITRLKLGLRIRVFWGLIFWLLDVQGFFSLEVASSRSKATCAAFPQWDWEPMCQISFTFPTQGRRNYCIFKTWWQLSSDLQCL